MDSEEALAALREMDELSINDRAERLADLIDGLGDGPVHLQGDEAGVLFDDVQATWIAGYFSATIVSAHAFCSLQLAGLIRLRTDRFKAQERLGLSLEQLAQLASGSNIIDTAAQGLCIELAERQKDFVDDQTPVRSLRYRSHTESSLEFDSEHPLLTSARVALSASIALAQTGP